MIIAKVKVKKKIDLQNKGKTYNLALLALPLNKINQNLLRFYNKLL